MLADASPSRLRASLWRSISFACVGCLLTGVAVAQNSSGVQPFENSQPANQLQVRIADDSSGDSGKALQGSPSVDDLQLQIQQLQGGMKQMQEGMEKIGVGMEKIGENLKITTVDKSWGIGVFGSLNGEMLYSEQRPFLPSSPIFIFPDLGRDTQTFEAHAKSTNLGLAFQGPEINGLKAGGLFVTYLFGEQFEADDYGFFIVRAYGELKNESVRYAVGLDGDLMNPLSPTMLNFNAGQAAGNFGFYRGQFRAERYFHIDEARQVTAQFALADPVITSFAEFDRPPNNFLESNGTPHLHSRIALGLGCLEGTPGQETRPFEVGFSGLLGELRRTDFPGPNRVYDVWAVGADTRWRISDRWGVKGEFFHGQAIGNYNAAILQVNNDLLDPIRSTGGWGELYWYWNPCLHTHIGYGLDDPLDSELTAGMIAARPIRNEFLFGNLIWDVTKNLEIGFEVSQIETSYANITPLDIDGKSMIYHTRVRLKF